MPDDREADDDGEAGEGRPRRSRWVAFRRWFVAAVVVSGALAAVGMSVRAQAIREDLTQRVTATLVDGGFDWASARIEGRDVVLTGVAPALGLQEEAVAAVAGVFGVADIRDETGIVPLVAPFTWEAARNDGGLAIVGYVPSADARHEIGRTIGVLFPDVPVNDATEVARGAPPDFPEIAGYAARILANFVDGRVAISAFTLDISGLATDAAHYEQALELVTDHLPAGFTVGRADIVPPVADPYVWQVVFDGAEAVITGFTPTTAVADALAEAAAAAIPNASIVRQTALASGEPAAFESYVRHALDLASRLGSGRLVLSGPSLEISGRARTPEDYEALLALIDGEHPAGLAITASEIRPAMAEAYTLEVVRSGNGVELIGLMPDEDARNEVIAEANQLFGSGNVRGRLQIADGAPRMDWIGAAKFALGQVAGLSGGSARISDHSYTITGAAATSETFEAIHDALARTLPASLVLATSLVSAPLATPFRFTASVGPDIVTLSGVVPSPEMRTDIVAAAQARFAPRQIAVEARLASGAPSGFEEAVIAGLQAASRLEGGVVELTDLAIAVTGVAPYDGAVERIEDQLRSALPDGFRLNSALTAKPRESQVSPAVCQQLLIAELGEGAIKFTENSAAIAPESEGRLDRLAAILERCPDAEVEVGGYTDSAGTAERNQVLSRIRAQSVVAYLVDAGIAGDRLSAVGYGEVNPIATNDTEEGRALNRRIEFKVLEP